MPLNYLIVALAVGPLNVSEDVDLLINNELASRKIPGINLIISQDDKIIKQKAYGKADLEQDLDMTTDHVFESGSIGKSFTATVILQLVQEGKLALTDTLETRLKNCPEKWKKITIEQLLRQVSGLQDYALVPGLGLIEKWTYEQWLTKLGTLDFDFPTGTNWAYSNSNYLILGKVAEEATGTPILDLVQKRIFDPLEMKRSYVADQLLIIPKRAHGYINLGNRIGNGLFIDPGYGDGSFINSPSDLIAYEKGFRENKLLSATWVEKAQSYDRLPSGRKTSYGLGWFIREINGNKVISHGGNTASCFASITRVPSSKLTIAVMGNLDNQPGDSLALRIAQKYDPTLLPKKYTAQATDPDPAMTTKLLGQLKAMAGGKPVEAELDPEYVTRMKSGRGRMITAQLAPFKDASKMSFAAKESDDPDTLYRYLVEADSKKFIVTFTMSREGKLFNIGYRPE